MHHSVRPSGRHPLTLQDARQVAPGASALADLLGELALGGVERVLPVLVELAGGQLEQCGLVDRLARLADEEQALAVEGHHGHRARVGHDLAIGLLAVVVAEAVDPDRRDPSLPDGLAANPLEAHRAASSTIDRVTSSICSSASTVTDSVGSWLRSVPFATFSTGRPAEMRALASLPPPVLM